LGYAGPGTEFLVERDRERTGVVVQSEPEMFENAGWIEEYGHRAEPVTPDVPIPPLSEVVPGIEPPESGEPASPGPATEPPD
jgi:hypothetical protein